MKKVPSIKISQLKKREIPTFENFIRVYATGTPASILQSMNDSEMNDVRTLNNIMFTITLMCPKIE